MKPIAKITIVGLCLAGFVYAYYRYSNDQLIRSVSMHLLDPESARFEELDFNRETKAVCGAVNAKNRFGGYVGFQRFYKRENMAPVFEPESEPATSSTERQVARLRERIDFLAEMKRFCTGRAVKRLGVESDG